MLNDLPVGNRSVTSVLVRRFIESGKPLCDDHSLTKRLVFTSVGIPAVFHGIDQEVGHESVNVGRSPISQPRPTIDFRGLH